MQSNSQILSSWRDRECVKGHWTFQKKYLQLHWWEALRSLWLACSIHNGIIHLGNWYKINLAGTGWWKPTISSSLSHFTPREAWTSSGDRLLPNHFSASHLSSRSNFLSSMCSILQISKNSCYVMEDPNNQPLTCWLTCVLSSSSKGVA